MEKISIKSIRYGPQGIVSLFAFICAIRSDLKARYLVDFSECHSITPSAIALLGGVANILHASGGKIIFDWQSMQPQVFSIVKDNGFMETFKKRRWIWRKRPSIEVTSIPYLENRVQNEAAISNNLLNFWFKNDYVKLSNNVRDHIIARIWEIYLNSFEHSESAVGVFTCGIHLVRERKLKLTVADFGLGIPNKIRKYLEKPNMSDIEAMHWAFKKGNSTRVIDSGIPGGLGLDLLTEFVRLNQGKMAVYSNKVYYVISESHFNIAANLARSDVVYSKPHYPIG